MSSPEPAVAGNNPSWLHRHPPRVHKQSKALVRWTAISSAIRPSMSRRSSVNTTSPSRVRPICGDEDGYPVKQLRAWVVAFRSRSAPCPPLAGVSGRILFTSTATYKLWENILVFGSGDGSRTPSIPNAGSFDTRQSDRAGFSSRSMACLPVKSTPRCSASSTNEENR